ncbi:MAG: GerMN domain-containing protein [Actinomycetota bacterium]
MRKSLVIAILAACLVLPLPTLSGCGSGGATQPTAPDHTGAQTTPSTGPGAGEVDVFLLEGETVRPSKRSVAVPGAKSALEELLKGPTAGELAQGLHTEIPSGTRLNSFEVTGGIATADLSSEVRNYGGGSARVQAIMSQIQDTIMANDDSVKTVAITVDGVPSEEALQP